MKGGREGQMDGGACYPVLLGHPTQSQHVEADVTDPHRLVQVKLNDGDFLYGTLVAEQAAAVTAVMFSCGDSKLGSTFITV